VKGAAHGAGLPMEYRRYCRTTIDEVRQIPLLQHRDGDPVGVPRTFGVARPADFRSADVQ
jgi:hypothetical protein